MEFRLRKNGIDPKELLIITKALKMKKRQKAWIDEKQTRIMVEDETTTSGRITTNDD